MKIEYKIGDKLGVLIYKGNDSYKVSNSGSRKRMADFECTCSKIFKAVMQDVKSRNTKSCGCLYIKNFKTINKTHGLSKTTEYKSWCGMKERCYKANNKKYKNYGGRGIIICDRWLNSFENFLADIGNKPSNKHSIDRINNNGNYEPNNCRWATNIVQSKNRRDNIFMEYKGERMTKQDWSRRLKTPNSLIDYHLKSKPFSEVVEYFTKNNK